MVRRGFSLFQRRVADTIDSRMALTPPQSVADLLHISVEDVEKFPRVKPLIVA